MTGYLQSMPPRRAYSRRQVLKAAATAAAAGLAAGCGRAKPAGGPVTIDFYTYSTPEFRYLFANKLIPAFEKKHPGIKVRFNEAFGEMYDGKLLTLIAGKVAPDVFHVTQTNFPAFAAKEVPLPLDEFVAADGEKGEFKIGDLYPVLADAMRYKGKFVGLPSDFSTIVMFYNRDLFDRYGVAYPKPGWTWDDFVSTAHRLTKDTDGDGRADVWGTANQPAYNRWPAWVWMAGGDIFNKEVTRCTMDSPESIEGFTYYTGLSLKEKVAPRPNLLEQDMYQQLFAASRIGMIADSRYAYKRYLRVRKLGFKWDLAEMPRGKQHATTFIWGGNCIFRGTKHPRECWEFLKFMTGPEGAEVTLEAGNALPPHRAAAEAEIANPRDKDAPANDRAFIDAIAYGRIAPFPRQYPAFNDAMAVLNESFTGTGSRTPQQACVEFTRQVNGFLEAGVF
jgi:multiple sugar transport system substrate-binding protein